MARTHWWLVPTLFDKPFMTKPPLHHWLIAASEIVAGHGSVFVWRLPSAITGALLCAAVCWFAARWFGRAAGLISGVGAVGMIAIWGQSQVADIDATNTFAAALTALCGIELLIVQAESMPAGGANSALRRTIWIAAATLASAATWMTKGPAGLPIILGAWIWGAVVAARSGHLKRLLTPAFCAPLLIGGAIFAIYMWAAKQSLKHHNLPLDLAGVREGARRLYPQSVGDLGKSLFVFIPSLFGFALPMSLALPLAFDRDIRRQFDAPSRRIVIALVAAILISWAICVATGMSNPRYAYPTLMLICPLAGAVAVAAAKTRRTADWLLGIANVTAGALVIATIGLGAACWKGRSLRGLLIASAVIAILIAYLTISRLPRYWSAAWGLAALFALTSIPFGMQRHLARTEESTKYNTSVKLRDVVGENTLVACFAAASDKPETFYYANVRVLLPLHKQEFIPANIPPGMWVILAADKEQKSDEYRIWHAVPGIRLEKEMYLCRNKPTDYYLAWYAGMGSKQ
jgi:4-amino-4-deoxy-L-arabinose transferase-like glycosyltransferase